MHLNEQKTLKISLSGLVASTASTSFRSTMFGVPCKNESIRHYLGMVTNSSVMSLRHFLRRFLYKVFLKTHLQDLPFCAESVTPGI